MKKRFFILSLIMAMQFQIAIAQNQKKIDSLKVALNKVSNDSLRINIYLALSKANQSTNNSEAILYEQKALKLAFEIKNEKQIAEGYYTIGQRHSNNDIPDSAILFFNKSLEIFQKLKNKTRISQTLFGLGSMKDAEGKYNEALEDLFKAKETASENSDNKTLSHVYNSIGRVYTHIGDLNKSLQYYILSLKIKESIGDKEGCANSLRNIGSVLQTQGEHAEALEYYYKALEIRRNLNDKQIIAKTYITISEIHFELKQFDKSIEAAKRCLQISEEINYRQGKSLALSLLGYSSGGLNNKKEAIQYYEKYISIGFPAKDYKYGSNYYQVKSAYYKKLGKINDAKKALDSVLIYAKLSGAADHIENAYKLHYKIDSALGNYPSYIQNYQNYIYFKDSLVNSKNKLQVKQQMLQYEFDKKETQVRLEFQKKQDSLQLENTKHELNLQQKIAVEKIETEYKIKQAKARSDQERQKLIQEETLKRKTILLEFEKKKAKVQLDYERQKSQLKLDFEINNLATQQKQKLKDAKAFQEIKRQTLLKNAFIIGFFALSLFTGLFYYQQRKVSKQKEIIANLKTIQLERDRIAHDMHDELGSGLTAISYLSQFHEDETLIKIHEKSHDLIRNMREIIWSLKVDNDPLDVFTAYLKKYADTYLEENNISLKFYCDLKSQSRPIPGELRNDIYLIIKEALHNIVKHAEADEVNIKFLSDRELFLSIKDNGHGMTLPIDKKTGTGISSMEKRISNRKGTIIFHSNNGLQIDIHIPFP